MYPIYIEQLPYQRHQSQLSVDDYAQIQHLLYQERAALHAYHQEQEKRRLQRAMYKLQVLTELQRRREQEELAIQAYYENKKRQQEAALLRQQLIFQQQQRQEEEQRRRQQQEEAFYTALIEHQQEQQRLYALAQQQAVKSTEYANPCHVIAEALATAAAQHEDAEEEDTISESEVEPEQKNLEALVKFLFGQKDNEEEEDEEEAEPEFESKQNQRGQIQEQAQEQMMTLDEFVDYISNKAHQLDSSDHEDNQQEQEQEQEEEKEDNDENDYVKVSDINVNNEDDTMEEPEDDVAALALEHLDENETEDSMDEDDMPDLVESAASLQNLVHDILTTTEYKDEFTKFPEEDPVKIAKFDALSRIEQELDTIRQQHEDHVLNASLDFPNPASPGTVLASTAENRQFLGYEDQIMKALLKLDMIESDGDEDIRNERKALVKRAEAMLAKLDDYKQKEWERVSCSSHSDEDEYMM
jgi:hypothetical protein